MESNPTLEIEKLVQDMQQNMHTCIPGKIESFDAEKCLASVTPTGQFLMPSGKLLDYPKVHDVPIVFIQSAGQNVTIAYPIKQDDECLLFFSEQQLDKFRDGEDAKCDLRFDLTSAICLVGLFSSPNDVIKEACDMHALIIDNKGKSRVTIQEDKQEYKVGNARFVLDNEKLLIDCDLEITGTVNAQKTIDAKGEISSKGSHSVSEHVHNFTDVTPSGAIPSVTQTPIG
jgi:hypothetical protein